MTVSSSVLDLTLFTEQGTKQTTANVKRIVAWCGAAEGVPTWYLWTKIATQHLWAPYSSQASLFMLK